MSDPPIPRRTQAQRTQQRKEEIIRQAILYFGQYGFHGARLADIARAAGVTEPGLLHHFPTKAHLLMEVLAERDRLDHQRFDPAANTGLGDLLATYEKLVEHNQTLPGLVQLFTVLVAESIDERHPGHEFFKRRYQGLRQQDVQLLRAGQEKGEIRSDIPAEDLAVMLFAMMDGLQIQWLIEPETVDMGRTFAHFIRLLRGN